jgi:hypothetical protein
VAPAGLEFEEWRSAFASWALEGALPTDLLPWRLAMTDSVELREVERRIQVVEDNLRQLQEQATALSGAADEECIANRIADQGEKLAALFSPRGGLLRGHLRLPKPAIQLPSGAVNAALPWIGLEWQHDVLLVSLARDTRPSNPASLH